MDALAPYPKLRLLHEAMLRLPELKSYFASPAHSDWAQNNVASGARARCLEGGRPRRASRRRILTGAEPLGRQDATHTRTHKTARSSLEARSKSQPTPHTTTKAQTQAMFTHFTGQGPDFAYGDTVDELVSFPSESEPICS